MILKIIGLIFFAVATCVVMTACIGAILDSFHRKSGRLVHDEETGLLREERDD